VQGSRATKRLKKWLHPGPKPTEPCAAWRRKTARREGSAGTQNAEDKRAAGPGQGTAPWAGWPRQAGIERIQAGKTLVGGNPGRNEARAARPPASRSTSRRRCRLGRRTPHSPALRPPPVRRPTTPRAPAPTAARRAPRLRPSSTVTRTPPRPRRRREKAAVRGVAGKAGPQCQEPIPKKESEGRGRNDF
jgi:hypothetical protein